MGFIDTLRDWWDSLFFQRVSSSPGVSSAGTRLYVGNLSYQAKSEEIKKLFERYGTVQNVHIVMDRFTKKPKGFAFVQMSSSKDAERALALSGSEFLSRNITVSIAKSQETRFRKKWSGGRRPSNNNRRRNNFNGPRGRQRNGPTSAQETPNAI